MRLENSPSSRAHLIDREALREVAAGAHTKFMPKVTHTANEPDATGQLIVKPVGTPTLCGQDADPVTLAPLEASLCQSCRAKAGMGKIVAAQGFRA